MKTRIAVLVALLLPGPALAEEPTLQSAVSQQIARAGPDTRFLTLNFENDMIGGGTDRNYTSGVRATWFDLGFAVPEYMKVIDRLLPTVSFNETTSVYYSVGQNLFTPKDITLAAQPANDRPWAAFLYASAGLVTVTDNHTDNVEATIGVVGPAALGRPMQAFVHKYISGSPTPRGWGNQLKNEPGLMLSWERGWPASAVNINAFGWNAGAVPHIGATVGNIYTYANAGLSLRLSPGDARWQDDPVRVRPSMPGTGAFLVPENKLGWYFFGGVEGRAIARNIFLDGNTFVNSHSIDKKPFVLDMDGGVAFTYGKARLSYALVYRTKEFDAQDKPSVFGTMSLGIKF